MRNLRDEFEITLAVSAQDDDSLGQDFLRERISHEVIALPEVGEGFKPTKYFLGRIIRSTNRYIQASETRGGRFYGVLRKRYELKSGLRPIFHLATIRAIRWHTD